MTSKFRNNYKPQLLGRRAAYFFVFGTNSLISFFLFHRLDNKADHDENRDKHYDRGDYVDDRMLLDEHRGKHDEEYKDIACDKKTFFLFECKMHACRYNERIVYMKARKDVSRRVDRMQIIDHVEEDVLTVGNGRSEL